MVEQRRRTILVTGASGFVGRPLISTLVAAGYAVRATARSPVAVPPGVELTLVPDFAGPVDWDPILRGMDFVVHSAGLVHADSSDIPVGTFDRINRATTQELAGAAARAGVTRVVFISSVRAQVGASTQHVLRETDEPHPTDRYGRSKLDAEAAVRASGVPYTILRPVVIYGPHAKANIRLLIRLAVLPLPLPFAAFTNRRSILSVDNLVSAILFALDEPAARGGTFLVADPAPVTLRDIFAMLRHAQGRKPGLLHVPPRLFRLVLTVLGQRHLWERIGDELVVDIGKLVSLGWHPAVDTYSGLAVALRGAKGNVGVPQ